MDIDLKIGDIVLGGRFKNHRMEAKKFGTDDLGQPTINGRKLLTIRLEKLMPMKQRSRKTQEETMNKQAVLNQIREDAYLDELEKVSGEASELLGSLFSVGLGGTGFLAGGIGAMSPAMTKKQLSEQDKKGISNALLPWLGAYRMGKRIRYGLSGKDKE